MKSSLLFLEIYFLRFLRNLLASAFFLLRQILQNIDMPQQKPCHLLTAEANFEHWTIFIVIMQVGVSVAVMQVVCSAVHCEHDCFCFTYADYCFCYNYAHDCFYCNCADYCFSYHWQVMISSNNFISLCLKPTFHKIDQKTLKCITSGLHFTTFVNILAKLRYFEGRNYTQIN